MVHKGENSLSTSFGKEEGIVGARNAPSIPTGRGQTIVNVPIHALRMGDSPRLEGEDKAHVMRLAATEDELPPILVDRRSMRVIDGFHRLMAASLKGNETIAVRFFDGTAEDAFLLGVEANVKHGLPLSQADRRVAAMRILVSHPDMSDRAIAQSTGLGTRTIAEMRRSDECVPKSSTRTGRDGRVRPLNSTTGRLRVAELIKENPEASVRRLAALAGVSPATALDVRKRLERGEAPIPDRAPSASDGEDGKSPIRDMGPSPEPTLAITEATDDAMPIAIEKLLRDPSLRLNERGRRLLRLLRENVEGAMNMGDVVAAVPPRWLALMTQIARHNSQMWLDFAGELERRAEAVDSASQ